MRRFLASNVGILFTVIPRPLLTPITGARLGQVTGQAQTVELTVAGSVLGVVVAASQAIC